MDKNTDEEITGYDDGGEEDMETIVIGRKEPDGVFHIESIFQQEKKMLRVEEEKQ